MTFSSSFNLIQVCLLYAEVFFLKSTHAAHWFLAVPGNFFGGKINSNHAVSSAPQLALQDGNAQY
jgi:hypothetical protein